ncbi:MAG: sugar-binding protein [Spirochaetaceae bacterium]
MKKTNARWLLVAAVFIVVAAALPAGGSSEGDDDTITIAVIPKAMDNPVFLDTRAGAEKAAEELGIELIWTASLKSDAAEQVQVIEGLIQRGVDGMLISANDPTALNDVIAKARSEGIAVATFDSDAPESGRDFFVGIDNYEVGKLGGQEYAKLAADMGGTVQTALLTGILGAYNLEERIRGFRDGVAGTNVEIVSIQTCEDDINKAVQVIDDYTSANPNLDGWFFVGGWPFFAPPESLGTLQEFVDDGGLVVSIDNFWPMLDFIESGMTPLLIGYSFYDMGYEGVYSLVDLANGESVPEMIILDASNSLTTMENIDEIRETKLPW